MTSSPYCIPVKQDHSWTNMASSVIRSAARPFWTLYYGALNIIHTRPRHWLTSSLVLRDVTVERTIFSLESMRKRIESLDNNKHISIHTACKLYVNHSTVLTVGKDGNGNYYALFFDPQGNHPSQAHLIEQEIVDAGNTLKKIKTAETLYQELTNFLTNPPPLQYNASLTQWDYNTCVAYSAAFLEALEHIEKTQNFDPELFMKQVANHEIVTLTKVHQIMLRLYEEIQKEKTRDAAIDASDTDEVEIQGESWAVFKDEDDIDTSQLFDSTVLEDETIHRSEQLLNLSVVNQEKMNAPECNDWVFVDKEAPNNVSSNALPSSTWSLWRVIETVKNCSRFIY